ncbi:17068_t:CDS:1, partial [Rhizophagus irregularis]
NVIDQENLKRQVKASQSEYERIELFLNEYLHNNTSTNHERSTNLRKDEMWSLVEKLLIAFDTKDFNHYNQTHDLFHTSYPKEIHADGIRRLKECYKRGLHRIHLIYAQEVLKKEKIDTTGRRVKEVLVTKCKDIEKPPRKRKNTNILDNQPGSSDEPPKKRVRRIPSKEAVEILAPMVAHSLPPTKEEVQRYLAALEGISSSSDIWDAARLTQYYKNRHKKAK